jgi:hypothetical protein
MNGHAFANDVVIPDFHPGLLSAIGEVLGRIGNHRVSVDTVARADACVTVDDGVGADDGTGSDAHLILDYRVGTHVNIVGKPGAVGDDGSGVALFVGHQLSQSGAGRRAILTADEGQE